MNTTNGDNGTDSDAALTGARPVVLVRYRPGVARETARTVHLAPLPLGGQGAVSALCGALLRPEEFETVAPGHGMPCELCVISHVAGSAAPLPPPPEEPSGADARPEAAALGYRTWGWPVTLRRDQVWLSLNGDTVAVIMPVLLAAEVTTILGERRCPPAVLAHPYAPEHRILLAGEPYGIALPWPPGVHRVTGTLLLPPTVTPRGPLTWVHRAQRDTLRLCREIDVVAAVRTALRDPPPKSGPVAF